MMNGLAALHLLVLLTQLGSTKVENRTHHAISLLPSCCNSSMAAHPPHHIEQPAQCTPAPPRAFILARTASCHQPRTTGPCTTRRGTTRSCRRRNRGSAASGEKSGDSMGSADEEMRLTGRRGLRSVGVVEWNGSKLLREDDDEAERRVGGAAAREMSTEPLHRPLRCGFADPKMLHGSN